MHRIDVSGYRFEHGLASDTELLGLWNCFVHPYEGKGTECIRLWLNALILSTPTTVRLLSTHHYLPNLRGPS
jgi:hypothetical protein